MVQPQGSKGEHREMEEGFLGLGRGLWQWYTLVGVPHSVSPSLGAEDFNGRSSPQCCPHLLVQIVFFRDETHPFFLGRICASFSESRTSWAL